MKGTDLGFYHHNPILPAFSRGCSRMSKPLKKTGGTAPGHTVQEKSGRGAKKESLPKKERGYSHGKNHDCPDCHAGALQRL
jgi:hypothetical protein